MNVQILEASVEFFERPFITPLVLSSGPITQITEARASVRVNVDGKQATGRGAIYLSDLWAWPDAKLDHAFKDEELRKLCTRIATDLRGFCGGESHHRLELGLRLHENVCAADTPVATLLARAICASPFDAAIHDAAGIALNRPAMSFCDQDALIPSADKYFAGGAIASIRRLLQPAKKTFDAWWIVGGSDAFDEKFARSIIRSGYRCFKLKVRGKDNVEDVSRTIAVFDAARNAGIAKPRLSIDSNEANPDADSVRDYLHRLRGDRADVFAAVEYLEQPTSRDIRAHRYDWHTVSSLTPVLLDEGLTSLDLLPEAHADGWSGVALKTCKGHSFTLIAAAWAREHGMLLAMQDLTNPGFAAIG
jgi:L-alanine-DL-glutamate epimerase-like enolase superfamily enzyme